MSQGRWHQNRECFMKTQWCKTCSIPIVPLLLTCRLSKCLHRTRLWTLLKFFKVKTLRLTTYRLRRASQFMMPGTLMRFLCLQGINSLSFRVNQREWVSRDSLVLLRRLLSLWPKGICLLKNLMIDTLKSYSQVTCMRMKKNLSTLLRKRTPNESLRLSHIRIILMRETNRRRQNYRFRMKNLTSRGRLQGIQTGLQRLKSRMIKPEETHFTTEA